MVARTSVCWPHELPAIALRILFLSLTLFAKVSACLANVCRLSKVTPSTHFWIFDSWDIFAVYVDVQFLIYCLRPRGEHGGRGLGFRNLKVAACKKGMEFGQESL